MKVIDGPDEPTSQPKYLTFKTNDFYEMMGELGLPPYPDGKGGHVQDLEGGVAGSMQDCAPIAQYIQERVNQTVVPDAVVIRRSDAFAPPALDAYANTIMCLIEGFASQGPLPENIQKLSPIADYFHDQAAKAWDDVRRLPD